MNLLEEAEERRLDVRGRGVEQPAEEWDQGESAQLLPAARLPGSGVEQGSAGRHLIRSASVSPSPTAGLQRRSCPP